MSALDQVKEAVMAMWLPPERLSLSEWADRHFVMSPENSAQPGKWTTLPYQREILDAITDPRVERVTLEKSSRVGYTLMMSAGIGYYIEHDPANQLVVQPTVDDAKDYSKETISAMLRDVPALNRIVFRDLEERGPKDPDATLRHKSYPGGVLSLIGANSGAGFRRRGCRVVWFDEVDGYPLSAGIEGDQIRLGIMRTQTYWNRKIVAGSTPLVAATSRIHQMFEAGDQRRYHVPCPSCRHMDYLTFREETGPGAHGHWMAWPDGEPRRAHFVCRGCGAEIEHRAKRAMVEAGEWRAAAPFRGHASFHIWAAYSFAANATWGQLAEEFLDANAKGPEQLKTFVNTALGEVWHERGEAPDWKPLYDRRESRAAGAVPAEAVVITAGVDVQHLALYYEVVGWAADRQNWSLEAAVIPGDTATPAPWAELDKILARTWARVDGQAMPIHMLAVDSGDQTQVVYNWARGYPLSRVIACKGVASARVLIGAPSPVDVTVRGKRIARGYRVWPVSPSIAKSELYGWLRLERPAEGQSYPPGFCHFPEHGEDYFKQLTAEHLVKVVHRRTRFVTMEWQVQPGRENHWLDCRVYARAAAALAGLDRYAAERHGQVARPAAPGAPPAASRPEAEAAPAEEPRRPAPSRPSWLRGGRGAIRGSWIRR